MFVAPAPPHTASQPRRIPLTRHIICNRFIIFVVIVVYLDVKNA
jgi:hypothetical protein